MKVLFIIIAIVISVVMSGCSGVARNFKEMTMDSKAKQAQFVINQNYQVLYKRALEKSRECHEMNMITGSTNADGQIFTELKEAELYFYMLVGGVKNMEYGAKFKAIDDGKTNLIIYSYPAFIADNDILKREFTGECNSCGCVNEDKPQ